jgi:hypothetical protein
MSEYSISCECGKSHPVSATQAGFTLGCSCGRTLDIPTLSSLRRSAGESAIPTTKVDEIQAMIRNGELPAGEVCPYSGRPADDTILFHVRCERPWIRGNETMGPAAIFVYYLFFGWIGALIVANRTQPLEELGRDTAVEVPVRISSQARPRLMRMRRQRSLKAILRQTRVYAELLRDFPEATVSVVRTNAHSTESGTQ